MQVTGNDGWWTLYGCNASLMGWLGTTGEYYNTSYSFFGSGNQNIKEADVKQPPQQTAMWYDGQRINSWWNPATCRIGNTNPSQFFTPHFSSDQYTYAALLGLPSWPNLVAGGGYTPVGFMDGHARPYTASDFPNSGLNFDSWQLDVD